MTGAGGRCLGLLTALLLHNPAVARADWVLEKISDERFSAVAIGRVGDRQQSRLYALGRGSANDVTHRHFDVPEGMTQSPGLYVMTETTKNRPPGSRVYEITPNGTGWDVQHISWHDSHGADLLIGEFCGTPALYAQYWDSFLVELSRRDDKWVERTLRPARPRELSCPLKHNWSFEWPRTMYPSLEKEGFISSLTGIGSYRFRCAKDKWRMEGLGIEADERSMELIALGDARGDGKKRHYGFALPNQRLFEAEEVREYAWKAANWLAGENPWRLSHISIGDARNDGQKRLYVAGFRELSEYEWKNGRFIENRIAAQRRDFQFNNTTVGLAIADLRGDGRRRLYVANGTQIMEYAYIKNHWTKEVIAPGIGEIGFMESGVLPGWPHARLLLAGDVRGLYTLRWKPGKTVVVAPFLNRSGAASEADGFADLFRVHLAGEKGCRVLEREQIEEVMREQKLQLSGVVDPKEMVRLGSLLGADSVVAGSIGKFNQSYLIIAHAISVQSGAIESSWYRQWQAGEPLGPIFTDLGRHACPTSGVSR